MPLLKSLHPNAEEYFNSCCQLQSVCEGLIHPDGLVGRRVQLMQPFTPMLAAGYKNHFQKVENLNRPLKYINSFLLEQGIRNTYSAENIIDGDER